MLFTSIYHRHSLWQLCGVYFRQSAPSRFYIINPFISMPVFNPTLFLASLREILKDDFASLAYTDEELCFLANYDCPLEHQLPYDDYDAFMQQLTERGKAAVAALPNYNPFYQVHQLLSYERLKQHGVAVKAIVQMEPNGRNLKWLLARKDKQERQKRLDRKRLQSAKKEEALDQTLPDVPKPEPQPEPKVEVEAKPEPTPEPDVQPKQETKPTEQPNEVRKRKPRFPESRPYATNLTSFKEVVPNRPNNTNEDEVRKKKTGWDELKTHARQYMR